MEYRTLTEFEGFEALREYLLQYQREVDSEQVDHMVHEVDYTYVEDGKPVTSDPAAWGDWTKAVDKVVARRS